MNVGLNTRSITINKNDFDSQQYFREFHRSTRQKEERKAEREWEKHSNECYEWNILENDCNQVTIWVGLMMIFIVGMSANQCGGTAKCVVRFMRKENQERNYSTQTPFGAQNKSASANRLSLRTDNKRPYALCYNGFGYRARTRFIPFASFGYLNFSSVFSLLLLFSLTRRSSPTTHK